MQLCVRVTKKKLLKRILSQKIKMVRKVEGTRKTSLKPAQKKLGEGGINRASIASIIFIMSASSVR